MGQQNGYQVDLAALDQAAKGVQSAHDALSSLLPVIGGYATSGGAADYLHFLTLSEADLGHPGLTDAYHGFLSRRSWDLRTRLTEGQKMVSHLQDSRTLYQKTEDAVSGILKEAVEDVAGNPDKANASRESWSQIGQDVRPDWAKKSFYDGQQERQGLNSEINDARSAGQDLKYGLTNKNGIVSALVPGMYVTDEVREAEGKN